MLNLIFPKKSPQFAGFQFDAVLEDTLEASVELTRYPIESGVKVNDHRIVDPFRYYITGAIGSQPLKPLISPDMSWTDLQGIAIGAASNLLKNNPYIALVAGVSIGALAGNDQSRGSAALQQLIQLMQAGLPFDVDAVDIQLRDMVITKISRTREPENEEGLVVVVEIQELITLDRIQKDGSVQPNQSQLSANDPANTSCTRDMNRGEQIGGAPSAATSSAVTQATAVGTPLPALRVGQ